MMDAGMILSGGKEKFIQGIKKALCVLILSAAGLLIFGEYGAAEVSAAGNNPGFEGWVQDDAGLLTPEEEEKLEKKCAKVSEQHNTGVYIITTPDFGGGDIQLWQSQIFAEYGLGTDFSGSGVMFAVSIAESDWGLVGFGAALEAFTTYGREQLGEAALDDLSAGEFYDAFDTYVSMADDYLAAADRGDPYTADHPYVKSMPMPVIIGGSFLLSFFVSSVILASWKSSMNTRVSKDGASEYMKEDSFRLYNSTDHFLYNNVTRTKKETSKKSEENRSSGRSNRERRSGLSGTSGKF